MTIELRTPFTERELEIAELVGRGLRVKDAHTVLGQRGRHMALSTLETRIRELSRKIQNPHCLPPMAIIRLWWGMKHAA